MFSTKKTSISSVLSFACAFLIIFHPCAGATFDAKSEFAWIDSSCTNQMSRINDAGDDYNKLVQAGLKSVASLQPPTHLGVKTLRIYLGTEIAIGIKAKFTTLQMAFKQHKLSLYCDGSAFEWVTKYQEGPEKDQPLVAPDFPNKGAWHSKEGRYNPNAKPLYIRGEKTDQRNDFCQDPKGNNAYGVSTIRAPTVVLCPDAFKNPIRQTIPTTKQNRGVTLDSLQSTGSVLFHEMTHCVLETIDAENGYGAVRALVLGLNSKGFPPSVQKNADNWLYYAMAVYANQNAWVLGVAEDTTAYADTAAAKTAAKRQLPGLSANRPSNNPPTNNPPTDNNNDNNKRLKSQSKQHTSATSSSRSTTSSRSSSTSSASSFKYNIQSAIIDVEGSDTIGFEAATAAIASEAAALTITGASGSSAPTTLVTSPRTTSQPAATSSKSSCMRV